MHELSLAMSILDMVEKEVGNNNAGSVNKIQLEVGTLSGVDAEALKFALSFAAKNTVLDGASIMIILTEGLGRCYHCNRSFVMTEVWTPCPVCNVPAGKILEGEELKFLSITVDD